MTTGPQIVIIGAGIVGCALADELTARGHTDVLVLEQGPLFATGGSTSHAPGLVFQTTGQPTMTRFARATAAKYRGLRTGGRPCFHTVGGLEVATTRDRLTDLHRRHGWATAAGIDSAVIDPSACAGLHPLLDRDRVLGGLHIPSDGLAVPVAAAEAQARAATARGARFRGGWRVTGVEVRGGRIRGVRTDHGRVGADVVISCAGMWGPLVGALAGVRIPLHPMAHQYAWTTPLAELEMIQKLRGLVEPAGAVMPILRHQDADLYAREHGDRLGIGAYGHRAMPTDPDTLDTPTDGMPSERAFTADDFEPSWAAAVDLLPALGDAKVERGVNGLFSFTPDGLPLLGEHPDVGGFWAAEAVWITHSAGVAEAVAEWLTTGCPAVGGEPVDVSMAHLDRFDPATLAPATVRERASTAFDEVYDISHPHAPAAGRPLRTSPFHARHRELGAALGEHEGWARPMWFADNDDLPEVCEIRPRRGWAGRHWSPIAGAEALVARRAVALVDLTPRRRGEVTGPNALGLLQQLATADLDRPIGSRTRTLMLDTGGSIRADLDVARLGDQHFLLGAATRLEIAWVAAHVLGDVAVRDVTSGTCALGVWGPRAAELLGGLGLSTTGDAVDTALGPVPVTALRGTGTVADGWELRTTADLGAGLWDVLWEAGAGDGVVAAGHHAVRSLAVEAGPGAWPAELGASLQPVEAGLGHLVDDAKGPFVGRDALRRRSPERRAVTLVLDEPGEVVLGGEPVLEPGGEDAVGRVGAAEVAHTTGSSLAHTVVPTGLAVEGTPLVIDYLGRRLTARVTVGAPAREV